MPITSPAIANPLPALELDRFSGFPTGIPRLEFYDILINFVS